MTLGRLRDTTEAKISFVSLRAICGYCLGHLSGLRTIEFKCHSPRPSLNVKSK